MTNGRSNHRASLLPAFFRQYKNVFDYTAHSPYLVTLSRQPVEVVINTTAIIVSMVDNRYGVLQFPSPNGDGSTQKAFFSAKTLFKDGYVYQGDMMKLGSLEFDGYKIPKGSKKETVNGNGYNWYAVLVWCGRKPSPKFCANIDDLTNNSYFQSKPDKNHFKQQQQQHHRVHEQLQHGQEVKVGQVLEIRKNGAVVGVGKDSKETAFIHGWQHKIGAQVFLTTTQGVELAKEDLITFAVDTKQRVEGYTAVGCNITVLKHGTGVKPKPEPQQPPKKKTSSPKKKSKKAKARAKSNSSSSYLEFLLKEECGDTDVYDSDEDPSFICSLSFDPELDYDEYSNGEVSDDELDTLVKESVEELELVKQKFSRVALGGDTAKKGDSSTDTLVDVDDATVEAK